MDPIRLEIFKHLLASVAEEMGAVLQKSSYSPNIKERRDFSCAVFNGEGQLIAQAAHIPVHLGSMSLSVLSVLERCNNNEIELLPGDVFLLNDPFRGGTHLPDITMISPVFDKPKDLLKPDLIGFVANRAHHSDVGGITPGSMPVASEIYQEGLIIPPVKLVSAGELNQDILNLVLANVRTPEERRGDLWAQIAANQRGISRLKEIAIRYTTTQLKEAMLSLLDYTERITRTLIGTLPSGDYSFEDYLDDDGVSDAPVRIKVRITITPTEIVIDFAGSAEQRHGSINAVYAITLSAIYYVFRCLMHEEVPNNAGLLRPFIVRAPSGTVVNAQHPAPVAGGNVEMSQRIVDVLFGALSKAIPDRIPAASQGTMNNITIGGFNQDGEPFAYYETIGGGMGARPTADGMDAVHTHMTNTLNTPVEALEYAYPLQVLRYAIRQGSGGAGAYHGGEGIQREIKLLVPAQVTLLTERRRFQPYGLHGGLPGQCGKNEVFAVDGNRRSLPGKGSFEAVAGDVISILTPGGGGFGKPRLAE